MNLSPSESTPHTLVEELATTGSPLSWERFFFLYQPLLERWLQHHLVSRTDIHDLIQDTLVVVFRRIPEFQHNGREGAFRNWLKQIVQHQVQEYRRDVAKYRPDADTQAANQLEDPNSNLEQRWDAEHDRELLRRLLQLTKPNVTPLWWEAFFRTTIIGEPTSRVAEELGMTVNAVYIARSRVMQQLRRMSKGLIDSAEES